MAAPTLQFAVLANGVELRQVFSRACEYAYADPNGLTMSADRGPVLIDGDETAFGAGSVRHELSRPIYAGETLTVSWNPGPGEFIRAVDNGEEVAPFTGFGVLNSSALAMPDPGRVWRAKPKSVAWLAADKPPVWRALPKDTAWKAST